MGLTLAGCRSSIGSEEREAGWVNTPDGVIIVRSTVEMSAEPRMPMDHGRRIHIDSASFSAWQVRVTGDDAATMRALPVGYSYDGAMPEPWTVVPRGDAFVPLSCAWTDAWWLEEELVRCAEKRAPAVTMLGGRMAEIAQQGTLLRFGRGLRCALDLTDVNPAAAQPIPYPGLEDMWDSSFGASALARFSVAPIDDTRFYIADQSVAGIALFLVTCDTITPLGAAHVPPAGPLDMLRFTLVDMVPDGSVETPAVLSSERMDDPPPPFQMQVRRSDGRIIPVERVLADTPGHISFMFEGPPAGFFANNPALLLYEARVIGEGEAAMAELLLLDPETGERITRHVALASEGSAQ